MTLTPGNWIAFQTPSQKANITKSPGEHWSVGIMHDNAMCHGVGQNDDYMLFSGIGTKDDALAMAAAPAMLEALEAVELARLSDAPEDWQRATDLTATALSLAKGESA